MVSRRSTMER